MPIRVDVSTPIKRATLILSGIQNMSKELDGELNKIRAELFLAETRIKCLTDILNQKDQKIQELENRLIDMIESFENRE